MGSLLCGSSEFIERARFFRRMVGGNMRQAGPLAAAGLVALETMVHRLSEDHARAQRLGRGLQAIGPDLVEAESVQTNLVKVSVGSCGVEASRCSAWLEARGIRVSPCETHALRFVTHRHIGDTEVDEAIAVFSSMWRGAKSL